jgi:PIN domain nuclease of toxin-antitoxin system
MRLLLDTNAFLWWLSDAPRLHEPARRRIERAERVWISVASLWEIAIKVSIGKLRLEIDEVTAVVGAHGLIALPVEPRHVRELARLPLHHRDPFDRMLVAQARVEDLTVVSGDRRLAAYGIAVVQL